MKLKLLLLLNLVVFSGFCQSPISTFYGANNSSFATLTSANALDHSATGANQAWNFNQLVSLGTSVHTYVAPTTAETTNYPGTTNVIVTTATQGTTTTTGNLYTKDVSSVVSITGLTASGLTANFNTNNATLGAFPMNYGFTNNDNVAGNYTYTTYNGTFTGTLVTTVDAYGTLTLNDPGNGAYSGTVTRLKTVLNISLNYGFFSNIGTVTQTSYSYYDATFPSNNPVLRSVNTIALVPLLSVNQNDTTIEKFATSTLFLSQNMSTDNLWIKNPIYNSVQINSNYTIENASIYITDILGKTIFTSDNQSINGSLEIPVSLSNGVYLITIKNDKGTITKKIVKR